nr:putative haemoglobin [Aspergillus oryzae]
MPLSPEQIQLIKATVPVLQQHGTTITTVFYNNMLTAHPELNAVFNNANKVNGHQPRALAGALFAYASHIDDLGALGPAVELICNKHASLYIQPEQYQIVGKFLLEAMGEVLGDALTPEILDAWATAYWQLADLMIGREAELYKQADG